METFYIEQLLSQKIIDLKKRKIKYMPHCQKTTKRNSISKTQDQQLINLFTPLKTNWEFLLENSNFNPVGQKTVMNKD